jgi:hypothetical protein
MGRVSHSSFIIFLFSCFFFCDYLDCFSAAHLQRRRREMMMAYSSATKNCWESSDTSVCVCRVSPFICFSCFVLLLIFGSCRFFVFLRDVVVCCCHWSG